MDRRQSLPARKAAPSSRSLTGFLLAFLLAAFPAAPAKSAEVSIADDAGATVRLPRPAVRIIPLYAGLGEILVAMGLEDRLVGRTASDDALPADLPVVGTHMRPNPEIIAGLAPDLVVQFEGREEAGLTAEALQRIGIPVARFRIASFARLFSCVDRLGVLTGEDEAARRLTDSMRARLASVRASIPAGTQGPSVFFEVRYPNLLGAGRGSMVNDIILAAGGRNVLETHPERMARLSEEALVLSDPDLYLIQQGPMNKAPAALERRPHFRGLRAATSGFSLIVPETLYSRAGPKSVDAVEHLAALIRAWREKNGSAPGGGAKNAD